MKMPTKIPWCDKTWNPITGCSPISEGCQNCYAKRQAQRFKGRFGYPEDEPFSVTVHNDRFFPHFSYVKSKKIFVCSMGDLFHEKVKYAWQYSVFKVILSNPQCIFMILTKRPENMRKHFLPLDELPSNLWLGVTAENQKTVNERIPILLEIPAAVRFVSVEPMLERIDLGTAIFPKLSAPDWVICGGETGQNARPINPEYIGDLYNQCTNAEIPFFFKQWGAHKGNVNFGEISQSKIVEIDKCKEFPNANIN
jgi:protein gp37